MLGDLLQFKIGQRCRGFTNCESWMLAAFAAFWAGQSVRRQSRGVDPNDPGQVYEYYMHLWKLFYGSYLALPFAR